ncbi:MAG: hypothetical protein LBH96_04995 [Candidatus Peribacteria bacterium]|jgi:hypothetical protein|nr:hypothetical protein [Candidatus Peribacteria bacterium]
MLAQQRKIEAENAKKLATEHQRASNYRKEHENRKYNAGAEKTNTPSTTAQKTLANSKGKDLVDGNPSIMGYINERQQEETMNNELLNRRKKTEKIKAIQEYVTSKIGIPYQELDQQYFHEGILINPTELANLLSERKQISLEEATRLTEEIKNFNPNVDKRIERKSMNYMNTNKEIRLFALGQVVDFVKENLNITTEGQQNFAKDFILDHNDALKIKNEKLIIK